MTAGLLAQQGISFVVRGGGVWLNWRERVAVVARAAMGDRQPLYGPVTMSFSIHVKGGVPGREWAIEQAQAAREALAGVVIHDARQVMRMRVTFGRHDEDRTKVEIAIEPWRGPRERVAS